MRSLLVSLAFLSAVCADTSKWLDYRVKFSFFPSDVGESAFFPISRTLQQALEEGWIPVTTENSLGATTVCLSENDLNVCPIYDANGFIAGMQLAIQAEDLEGSDVYDVTIFDVYEKKFINGQQFWTSTYYLVDPKTIAEGGRTSANRTGDGLWIKTGSTYMEVPTDIESVKANTEFKWQNCFPNMGAHFYYNMTKTLDCKYFYPFFLLGKEENLIGLGWQVPGKTQTYGRDWFEYISRVGVEMAVPLGPDCLYSLVEDYGVVSLHMYFNENPWAITCDHDVDSIAPP